MKASWFTVACGAFIFCGCSADATQDVANLEAAEEAPAIAFDDAWNETLSGELVEGGTVDVHFDPARLAQCEGVQGGYLQWAVTGHWLLDGETDSFEVISPNRPEGGPVTIELPAAGTLELWFEASNRWGCHQWDSNYGENYRFDVIATDGTTP